MKRPKLDAEARLCATIFAGQVVIFALAAWHYVL
jgi:hypothetical protein